MEYLNYQCYKMWWLISQLILAAMVGGNTQSTSRTISVSNHLVMDNYTSMTPTMSASNYLIMNNDTSMTPITNQSFISEYYIIIFTVLMVILMLIIIFVLLINLCIKNSIHINQVIQVQ